MSTQTGIVAPQHLLSPLVGCLLLTQTSTAIQPADPWDIGPESFTVRGTLVSVVLKEMLEQRGHPHGGIND